MTNLLLISNLQENNLGGVRKRGWGRGFARSVSLWEEPHYDQELEAHGQEAEDAAFGADGAAGEPLGAVENGIGEMAFHESAAVGDGEEIGFAPVEAGVEAYGIPEIAGALKSEGKENADQCYAGRPNQTFTRIAEVDGTESKRKNESSGPAANAGD